MSIDRAALIEAAAKARYERSTGHIWAGAPEQTRDCYRTECGNWLDAALPLIADAIEADAHALKHRITAASADLGRPLARTMLSEVDGRILAARLVRSLLAAAEQDEPKRFEIPEPDGQSRDWSDALEMALEESRPKREQS